MLFFWNWHPILLFVLVLLLTYGVVQGLRLFAPGDEWTWSRWWSYKLGDAAVAGFIAFTAVCFREDMPDGWFTNPLVHTLLFIACMAGSFNLLALNIKSGRMSQEVGYMASERYHTLIQGFLFYVGIQALVALVWDSREPAWAFWAALACVAFYLATLAYDNLPWWQDHSPVFRGNR